MMILVPSRGRAANCKTPHVIPGVKVFVRQKEAVAYSEAGYDVEIQPESATGNMAKVRNAMLQCARDAGEDSLLMVDDDVTAVGRWAGQRKARTWLSGDEIVELAERLSRYARDAGVTVWGINVNADPATYRQYSPFSITNVVLGTFMGVNLPTELRFDEQLGLKEDYDFSIQALNKDRGILRASDHFYETVHLTVKGGCALYRTTEAEKDQFARLVRKWGSEIVRCGTNRTTWGPGRKKQNAPLDPNPIIRVPIAGI